MRRTPFYRCHPAFSLLYFASMLVFIMLLPHPVMLLIGFSTGLAYTLYLQGAEKTLRDLWYLVPIGLLTAIMNPLFNHQGATILLYLPSGNPLTLQAIAYGLAAGVMMAAVIMWFTCLNRIITADKVVYLGSRLTPSLAMVLALTLRFVPDFLERFRAVAASRQLLSPGQGRMKQALVSLQVMVGWALEGAVVTADSMKSRGYGLPGRRSYSVYRFTTTDAVLTVMVAAADVYLAMLAATGRLAWQYYPTLTGRLDGWAFSGAAVYMALGLLPLAVSLREDAIWRSYPSVI